MQGLLFFSLPFDIWESNQSIRFVVYNIRCTHYSEYLKLDRKLIKLHSNQSKCKTKKPKKKTVHTHRLLVSSFFIRTIRTRDIAFSLQGYSAKNEYEFLDLSDVDDIERTRLSSALLHKQQQKQQQRHPQPLQLFDKHERASLIKHDAADVQLRVSQSTTSPDSECQIVLNDNCNIQSNLNSICSTQNAPSGKHSCNFTHTHKHKNKQKTNPYNSNNQTS